LRRHLLGLCADPLDRRHRVARGRPGVRPEVERGQGPARLTSSRRVHRPTHAAPTRAMPPKVSEAAASGAIAATALITSGPEVLPMSPQSRQPPRYCARPITGAVSAPMVITIPEPSPLPTAIRIARAKTAG